MGEAVTIVSGDGVHASAGLFGLNRETRRGRTIVGWMPDSSREILADLIDRFEVESVIEVGSFVGMSACWFAERVDEVVCVDTFEREISDFALREMGFEGRVSHHEVFLRNTEAYPNITSYKMDSLTAAALPLKADLVYIDAGHEYEQVKADVEAWTPHARRVVCGDDNTPNWPSVQRYAREIDANVDGRVWWKAV